MWDRPGFPGNLYIAEGSAFGCGFAGTTLSGNNRIRKVSPTGEITTVAGTGSRGFSGDAGPPTAATFENPTDVAVDSAGNLYIADSGNGRIRKVLALGGIITIAGTGKTSASGDGGPATSAVLAKAAIRASPGIALDSAGNLYISDSLNGRVRKVSTSGIITTFAGRGTCCFSGDGGPATSAELNGPSALLVDSADNVYIADTFDNRIRKVSPDGIITTFAGNGTASFTGDGGPATNAALNGPQGLAMDSTGNIYIADTQNFRIRRVSPDGIITTFAGNGVFAGCDFTRCFAPGDGGIATGAAIYPQGIALDSAGNMYIADGGHRVRKVSTSGIITTILGDGMRKYSGDGGPATSAQIFNPNGVAVDATGNIYVTSPDDARIRKISTSGIITTFAGNGTQGFSGDGGPATSASATPSAIIIDSAENVLFVNLISGTSGVRIRAVLSAPPQVQVTPNQLRFTGASTGAAPPSQDITFNATVPGVLFTAQSDSSWLRVSAPGGAAPGASKSPPTLRIYSPASTAARSPSPPRTPRHPSVP